MHPDPVWRSAGIRPGPGGGIENGAFPPSSPGGRQVRPALLARSRRLVVASRQRVAPVLVFVLAAIAVVGLAPVPPGSA